MAGIFEFYIMLQMWITQYGAGLKRCVIKTSVFLFLFFQFSLLQMSVLLHIHIYTKNNKTPNVFIGNLKKFLHLHVTHRYICIVLLIYIPPTIIIFKTSNKRKPRVRCTEKNMGMGKWKWNSLLQILLWQLTWRDCVGG